MLKMTAKMKVFVKVPTTERKPAPGAEVIGLWDQSPVSTCVVTMHENGYWYVADPDMFCDCDQPDYWLEEKTITL